MRVRSWCVGVLLVSLGCSSPRPPETVDTATGAGTSAGATTNVSSAGTSEDDSTSAAEGGGSSSSTSDGSKFDAGTPDVGEPPEPPPAIPQSCEEAAAGESSVGCTFYAVDLDATNDDLPFGIAVANVQLEEDARVAIQIREGQDWQQIGPGFTVESLQLHSVELPDRHQEGTGLLRGAYRITSDVPIIAYQFQPINGLGSEFSDASLLYPSSTWDSVNHVISTRLASSTAGAGYPYISIVGMADQTVLRFTASNATRPGGNIPAIAAGETVTLGIGEGDVLSFVAESETAPLTGSTVITDDDHPVAVFSGHTCINIPDDVCCCDHIEEQVSGVQQWGRSFIAAHMPTRNPQSPETTYWQVYAPEDETVVNFDVPDMVTGLPDQVMLNAGQIEEYFVGSAAGAEADFGVTSNKPIALVGYMTSTEDSGSTGMGDPSMAQFAAVEQYLPRYVVLVPETWINDALVITRPIGAPITIDGDPVDDAEFTPVGSTPYEVARIIVPDGVHLVDGGDQLFGIVVVGWDEYDSYAYTGGTRTGIINPTPAG